MRRTLLLVATLGTFAMLAAPASAGDYRPHHPQATSSFRLGIFVWPAPKTIHQHHPRPGYLRPQPVYRYVHPLPRPRWHSWHRPQVRHFDRRHHGHSEWRHGDKQWRHGKAEWRGGDDDRRHGDGWRQRDHDRRDGGGWRNRDHDRRDGDGWRDRSGRDHARHDRRRD